MKYERQFDFYWPTVLDDGAYVDYALLTDWPSRSWWMVPGTWQED